MTSRHTRKSNRAENHSNREDQSWFCRVQETFHVLARRASAILGSAWSFVVAILIIVAWAVSGPLFHFSDTWQLVINTGTTIVTFLMVFLIQNTQNRDSKAVQLKLNELIRALEGARNKLVSLEDLPEEELKRLEKEFGRVKARAAKLTNDGELSQIQA
jgi:low affinity Fe/Cu permease